MPRSVKQLRVRAQLSAMKAARGGQPLPANFGGQVAAILEASKYRRAPQGAIDGWGRKWLP
jgi:hypothetical protein